MRYVGLMPTAPNVCSYTTVAKMNCQISTCLTTDTYFHKTFFVLEPNFNIFAEIHQRKVLKIHVAVRHHRLTYSQVPLPYNKSRN